MDSPLRAGIVGGGFMAEVHARAIRAAGHEVVGIVASTRDSTQSIADRLRVPQAFDSGTALIDSPDIDVIHVCTPNNLHVSQSLEALARGKPVVCEKPLATTLADATRMGDVAVRSGVATAVPFVYRYYPAVQEIRSRIELGEAGDLLLLHGSYLQDWLSHAAATNWRIDPVKGGASRAFADIGVHWCDLMEFVTGHRITRLTSRLITSYQHRGAAENPVGTEDVATIMFETDRHASGSLAVSQVSPGRKNRLWLSLDGTDGSFEFNQETPDAFWIGGSSESRIVTSGSSGMRSDDARRLSYLPEGHPQGYQDAFNGFMSDAYRSFCGSAVPGLPTFADGLRAAAITDAVVEASRSESWVDVAAV
ncbi:MAG: oxidoreductase domain protein [Microbacteriaceae bacterium]|jgi:predicted dehydrogenase|nr:oxidoreductase domain protein [Microbacteriaceae bacterium]